MADDAAAPEGGESSEPVAGPVEPASDQADADVKSGAKMLDEVEDATDDEAARTRKRTMPSPAMTPRSRLSRTTPPHRRCRTSGWPSSRAWCWCWHSAG